MIRSSLHVLERRGIATFWDQRMIGPGSSWREETERAIRTADVALLLVSPSYLALEHIWDEELPHLLERKRVGALVIFPIIVRPSAWGYVPGIADIRTWPSDGAPLSGRNPSEVDTLLASLTDEIARIAGACSEAAADEFVAPLSKRSDQRDPLHPDFFISHSKADLDFAESLKLRLERAGYFAWFDAERLKAGVDWRQEIDEALRSASAVIVVMSPDARGSDYVTYEWSFAAGAGVPVVPLLLRNTALHPRLAELQYIDFRQGRPWSVLLKTLGELARHRVRHLEGDDATAEP
jgi:hypothetical protein